MVVRVRYQKPAYRLAPVIEMPIKNRIEVAPPPVAPPRPKRKPRRNPDLISVQELSAMAATALSPASALSMAMAVWRLGQDLGFTRNFFLTDGPFSHWQVWFGISACLLACGYGLNQRARRPDDDEPATS
jgi:hypothetical protein